MIVCLLFRHTAQMGFAIFGGYIIFWIAFKCKVVENCLVNSTTDISYGFYLYAWPIASLIIWYYRNINPWALCIVTLVAAGAAGFASWVLIERPANAVAHSLFKRAQLVGA